MPRFYFHLCEDVEIKDPEGLDCPNLDAACEQAAEARALMSCDLGQLGYISLSHHIDVSDGTGKMLRSIRFSDAVKVTK